MSYHDVRYKRARETRAATVSLTRVPRRQLAIWRAEAPDIDHERPRTRAECALGPRPCPFVGCRWNLYLDVIGTSIKLNFPDLEPGQMRESCALDVAARGGIPHGDVGRLLNLTRERVRQIEDNALRKLARRPEVT